MSMWIAHKAADGDTLASIVKQYKNKDDRAILQYHLNKKIAPRLKKGEALKKGDVVWALNPKSKVYLVDNGKCSVLLEECGYKATIKEINRVMDRVLSQQKINYDAACRRHDAQIAINEDQNFVFAFVGRMSSVKEPVAQWKKARAAYKKLGTAVKGRDYKGFQKAAVECELAVSQYNRDVHAWVHGLIDVTGTTETVLKGVKTAGEFCAFAAAVTICAPASLGAAVVISASASATTGLVFDGYEQVGRGLAGEKLLSPEEMSKKFIFNAVSGAAGALIVGGVLKVAGPWMSRTLLSNKSIAAAASWIGKRLPERLVQVEMQAAQRWYAKHNTTAPIEELVRRISHQTVLQEAAKRFLTRIGVGTVSKTISTSLDVGKHLFDWVKSNPKDLKGGDDNKIAAAAGQHLIDKGVGNSILMGLVQKDMKGFRKILNEVIMEEMKKGEKKAA